MNYALLTIIIIVVVAIIGAFLYMQISSREAPDSEEEVTKDETMMESIKDGDYTIDTEGSTITWTGKKILVESSHTGTLSVKEGSVKVVDGKVSEGSFVIDMNSIIDDGSGVGDHLKSDDFFSVETFPEASFVITSVGEGEVTGDLTVKDKTNAITFPFVLSSLSDGTISAEATLDIDRSLWDVRYGSGKFFDDLGDKAIDDIIKIELDLKAKSE